jgi:hypothetical protein
MMMHTKRLVLAGLAMLLFLPCLSGQEVGSAKDKGNEPVQVPLKVQVVLTEFDGTQKISSFPYTLDMLATGPHDRQPARLRYGVKIPINAGANQVTYQDVGTNIDCHAVEAGEGQYRLDFDIERSSVAMPNSSGNATEWKPGGINPSSQPLIRSFRDEFVVIVKNGQTVEGTSAVDPITGHVQKVDVTLNVLK